MKGGSKSYEWLGFHWRKNAGLSEALHFANQNARCSRHIFYVFKAKWKEQEGILFWLHIEKWRNWTDGLGNCNTNECILDGSRSHGLSIIFIFIAVFCLFSMQCCSFSHLTKSWLSVRDAWHLSRIFPQLQLLFQDNNQHLFKMTTTLALISKCQKPGNKLQGWMHTQPRKP